MNTKSRFFRISKLRSLRPAEQVAAVCYRMRGGDIEFLLVQTGGGRWIFPKGRVEPGLTHAQAAAIEAFEEAGVHGCIEEAPFTQYRVRRPAKPGAGKQTVTAHLCEVLRLGPPQESGRNRTWFSVSEAKRYLQEDRSREDAMELLRVVGRSVTRIQQTRNKARLGTERQAPSYRAQKDPLQQVQLEASPAGPQQGIETTYLRYIRRLRGVEHRLAERDFAASGLRKLVPQLSATPGVAVPQKVTAIDAARDRAKIRN